MGLLDQIGNAPADSGLGSALMAAASALLTPAHRGGGMGAAFNAMPQAMQQAQMQAMQKRLFGLKEQSLDFEMSEAERKRMAGEQAAANRAAFLQALQQRGGFKPDMAPAGLAAGFTPGDLEKMAGAPRWGQPNLVNVGGVGVDPQTWQPVGAVGDPNKPFAAQMGPDGKLSTVANEPFQQFEVGKARAGATSLNNFIMPATPGQEAADKRFAGDFIDFATGGYADTVKQIGQLREASAALGSGAAISGPVMGNLPDAVLAATNPQAVSVKEMVQEVAQRNLRLILGAQFTEKEGDRLISRVFNPRLSEAENKKRVDRLAKQMEEAAAAKLDASQYFQQNGSLTGWKGRLPRLSDFDPDFRKKDDDKSEQPKRLKFNAATGRLE